MRPSNSRRHLSTTFVRLALVAAAVSVAVSIAACSSSPTPPSASGGSSPAASGRTTEPSPTSAGTATTSAPAQTGTQAPTAATSPTQSRPQGRPQGPPQASGPSSCAPRVVARMDAGERAGQLLMVGLDAAARRTSLDALVTSRHLGGVILLGGWFDGADRVRATTRHLARLASDRATAGLGLLLAADQEGGQVQQLRGDGFTRMPSARVQGHGSPSALTAAATTWADQLRRAGINVNLAPVADTVPTSVGRANGPIGRHDRQFSSNPDRVSAMVGAFIAGMRAGGLASTVKHFPGIGRISGNTDFTADGITDDTTTVDDPFLEPFRTGIQDGVELVMVGSAVYSRIDPGTNATFSKVVVTDLLRGRLSFDGVVITDDVGAARALAAVPVAERPIRFIRAGGDITLTARPSTVPAMHTAIVRTMAADPGFARLVEAAATRVVDLKLRRGLAHCG